MNSCDHFARSVITHAVVRAPITCLHLVMFCSVYEPDIVAEQGQHCILDDTDAAAAELSAQSGVVTKLKSPL